MYLPSKLNIRGTEWKVSLVDQPVTDDGEPANGTCCSATHTIEVKKDMPELLRLEIFIHEWAHALWHEHGLDEENVPEWVEHMIIVAVSKDLVNNKKIFEKILASCKNSS